MDVCFDVIDADRDVMVIDPELAETSDTDVVEEVPVDEEAVVDVWEAAVEVPVEAGSATRSIMNPIAFCFIQVTDLWM